MAQFLYYDLDGRCTVYQELHPDLKICSLVGTSSSVNGVSPSQFGDNIQSGFYSFLGDNSQLSAGLILVFSVGLLSGFFSKKR